jgi:hypothetical protein
LVARRAAVFGGCGRFKEKKRGRSSLWEVAAEAALLLLVIIIIKTFINVIIVTCIITITPAAGPA